MHRITSSQWNKTVLTIFYRYEDNIIGEEQNSYYIYTNTVYLYQEKWVLNFDRTGLYIYVSIISRKCSILWQFYQRLRKYFQVLLVFMPFITWLRSNQIFPLGKWKVPDFFNRFPNYFLPPTHLLLLRSEYASCTVRQFFSGFRCIWLMTLLQSSLWCKV